ncbi:MAG: ABC transporter permease [Oscillospiraceae bacterium]|nr:ABC transporter permease [Oscillospiraceae bacterium]
MGVLNLSFALTRACLGRIAVFVCLTALLCLTAGLLGSFLLGEGAMPPVKIAIVDEDDTAESRMLLSYLEGMEEGRELIAFAITDAAGAQGMMESGEATAAVLIPSGFMAGVLDGTNAPFIVTLDPSTPMRAGVVRVFAGVYADMLRTGQQGVYISLDAARQHGTAEQWQEMFRTANLRFLMAMMNRESVLEETELHPTGQVSVALHYVSAAFVFLMLLGVCLFLDVWARAASRRVLLRLSALGNHWLPTGLSYTLGAAIPLGIACLLLALLAAAVNSSLELGLVHWPTTALALFVLILCCGAFLAAISRLFGQGAVGNTFVFLYGLGGLFLSGGVLPPTYLAPILVSLGRLAPHYWLTRLLSYAIVGEVNAAALAGSLVFIAIFGLVAVAGVARGSKVGALI